MKRATHSGGRKHGERSPNSAEDDASCVRCSTKVPSVRLFCPRSVSGTGTVPRLQVRPLVSHNKDHYEKRQQHLSHFLRPASSARTNFCQTSKSPISHWHAVGVACRCRRIENSLKAYRPKHSLRQGRLPNIKSLNSLTEYREVPSRCPPASGVAPALASFHPRHRWGQGNYK